jgi:hypothetical protein
MKVTSPAVYGGIPPSRIDICAGVSAAAPDAGALRQADNAIDAAANRVHRVVIIIDMFYRIS